eukprot:TRINITY_DN2561_c0_g1_i1.p1 TRINITY_DN2561_c0_g1~~TRINITY_DN2561_c0_g1_i1.p1  ORF type:complete len:504 (+),score=45.54 TRINITY_DN2561_c0_g1_i1:291-1802(+)
MNFRYTLTLLKYTLNRIAVRFCCGTVKPLPRPRLGKKSHPSCSHIRESYFHGGITDSLFFVLAATTGIGWADRGPKGTVPRLVTMLVMISSCVFLALYTSIIISTMDATKIAHELKSVESMHNSLIACWNGGSYCSYVKHRHGIPKPYDTVDDMFSHVGEPKHHWHKDKSQPTGVIYEYPALLYYQHQQHNLSYSIMQEADLPLQGIGMVYRRQRSSVTLLTCLDDIVVSLKDSGDFNELKSRFFPDKPAVTSVFLSAPAELWWGCGIVCAAVTICIILGSIWHWIRTRQRDLWDTEDMAASGASSIPGTGTCMDQQSLQEFKLSKEERQQLLNGSCLSLCSEGTNPTPPLKGSLLNADKSCIIAPQQGAPESPTALAAGKHMENGGASPSSAESTPLLTNNKSVDSMMSFSTEIPTRIESPHPHHHIANSTKLQQANGTTHAMQSRITALEKEVAMLREVLTSQIGGIGEQLSTITRQMQPPTPPATLKHLQKPKHNPEQAE